jgi:hypothetical protein
MTFAFRALALSVAMAVLGTAALTQEIVFSGGATTSDDGQLGLVRSGIARDAGMSMTVVENETVAGMRKAALLGGPFGDHAASRTGNLCTSGNCQRKSDRAGADGA